MITKNEVKDCLGNVLKVGDRIAYAKKASRYGGSFQLLGNVIELLPRTVRCTRMEDGREFIARFPGNKVVRIEEAKDV
ncbi:hypothetical protein NB640_12320 [Oxalobacter vibrioformis]|uniref:Uncharacterized protein n=1 Tax=Oxalobacter vibrioformis TaxID=933080 RepID=A0A9E9LXC8_9BURK|nr:hypothetical protein [Oxalobacter vibrioformis]WAW09986.1 hypothetical protein NB640_12320 [Oxalobacter vibrioformis]